ncbi:KilA-N domain-containing protein [Vreelandella subglaciescola]|uniref:KilA-N domain-containing protein n=1 Tax=Vreelandella subglaciescola TaxID=29571 RepID=UPI0009A5F79D
MPELNSQNPGDLSYGLSETTRGRYGGTWAHPKLAVFFARWLDVRFSVACDERGQSIRFD